MRDFILNYLKETNKYTSATMLGCIYDPSGLTSLNKECKDYLKRDYS